LPLSPVKGALVSFCRLCCLEDGVGDSAGSGVASSVSVGKGVGLGLAKLVTFFVKVQKGVDPFKKKNSVGLSGVDPLINTTISFSSVLDRLYVHSESI
jgi:hypothetical protein